MKNLFTIFFFMVTCYAGAQEKYITKKGTIKFEASVPSFEEVKATNTAVTAILNVDKGEIAALALIKGFRFKNALMEEHFNENYIESDQYPKATFKGKIVDFNKDNLQKEYVIKGVLTLHGVSKEITINANLKQEQNSIMITSAFITKPSEFDIKIPGIVRKKIAEEVQVTIDFQLTKK